MESFIRGTCEAMCPKSEIELRTREKLVHFYELKLTTSGSSSRSEPDPSRMVKEFARSAAGMRLPRHWELRTVGTLKRTVRYLLTEILQDERRLYSFRYEFIFDRLRAIRQELVMQNLGPQETLDILEPSVRFLAYSAYRLCECHISEFDPKICTTHVQECLKKILRCYDDLDALVEARYERSRRVAMEGLYLMFNLGSTEAVLRGVNLPKDYREELRLQLSTNLEYLRGNFYRVLCNIKQLSALEATVATLKLPEIRRQLLVRFSTAYASKVLTVPLEWLGDVLHYPECDHPALLEDCQYYNLQLIGGNDSPKNQSTVKTSTSSTKDNWWDEEESFEGDILSGMAVKFERTRFDSSKPTKQPRRTECADRKLGQVASLAELLL